MARLRQSPEHAALPSRRGTWRLSRRPGCRSSIRGKAKALPPLPQHCRAQPLDRLAQLVALDAFHHAFELAGRFAFQRWRGAGAFAGLGDRFLDDADLVDGGEAEEAVDALDEFALGVGEKQ